MVVGIVTTGIHYIHLYTSGIPSKLQFPFYHLQSFETVNHIK